jgi:hypothetical protein
VPFGGPNLFARLRAQASVGGASLHLPALATEVKDSVSAALGKIGEAYGKAIYKFAKDHQIPVVHFEKGQNQEAFARPYVEAAAREGKERVVLIGIAQEKASVWRSWPRKGPKKKAHPRMDWERSMAYPNHFYFYLGDAEWGGAFGKTNAYAPFPIWLWLHGHEWAKRQLEKAGVK